MVSVTRILYVIISEIRTKWESMQNSFEMSINRCIFEQKNRCSIISSSQYTYKRRKKIKTARENLLLSIQILGGSNSFSQFILLFTFSTADYIV